MRLLRRSPARAALVAALVLVLPVAAGARGSLRRAAASPTAAVAHPGGGPAAEAPAESRVRALVALVDGARRRAAAPGLRDEERDALADLAWAQVDEALEDPLLRERARRNPDFLQVQALLLMDEGEDDEALAVLERLGVVAPRDPESHRLLALCLSSLGRTQGAAQAFRRALALGVGEPAGVRAQLAFALAAGGRREEGLAESGRAVAADPAAYFAHFVRGLILGQLGRREEERQEYLAAVQRERDDADLWEHLALSWESSGDRVRAREAWEQVVRIDPSHATATSKLK